MKDTLKEYSIQFVGLKLGKHSFSYHIDNKFFDAFEYKDFKNIDCNVVLQFEKKTTLIELHFSIEGKVLLDCDITNETYGQSIDNTLDLIVKFGKDYNDDNEDVLILPYAEHQLNVAQYIYEAIVLALPIKRTHPGLEDGSLKSNVLEKLKEFEIREQKENDPRWDKLNELLTSKKS